MSIVIDDPEIERLARALAAETGESVEEVVRRLLRETAGQKADRGEPHDAGKERERLETAISRFQQRFRDQAVDTTTSDEDLIGYDEHGLPG